MVEIIRSLCASRGINFAKLERELGFANGSIAKTNESTGVSRLKAIADYFGVTIEYLVTGKDPEDADASLYAKMKRDPTFWNYAKMAYFLPPAYQEQIYDYIEMVSAKADREQETVSA